MCYSKNASIRAAVIGIVGSFLLYNSNNILFQKLALFFAFVSIMQIYDAVFWHSLSDNDGRNNINWTITKIAMITNHLQPLVLAYLISSVVPLSDTTKNIIYMYIIVASVYSFKSFYTITYTVVSDRSAPSLDWEWNTLEYAGIMYTLFLLTLCVIAMELKFPLNYILVAINLLTFMFSKFSYKNTEIGRMWCYIACYVPLVLIVLEKQLLKQ